MPDFPDTANVSASPGPGPVAQAGDEETIFDLASMDGAMKFSTVFKLLVFFILAAGIAVLGVWLPFLPTGWMIAVAAFIAASVIVLVTLVHLYSRPKYFVISPDGMLIVWPGRSRKLPKTAFADMKLVTYTDLGPLKRRFGVGGLLGCFGWFTSEYMGNVDAYITRHSGLVYIRLKNRRPLLLTPVEAKTFLETLQAALEN